MAGTAPEWSPSPSNGCRHCSVVRPGRGGVGWAQTGCCPAQIRRFGRTGARERTRAGDPAVLCRAHGDPQAAAGTGRGAPAAARAGDPASGCAGVDGVAQLVDAPRYPDSIVLADAGGTSLAGLAKPLAVDELIGLAVALARAVAGMHRPRGDAPRHQPRPTSWSPRDGAPCLVDFALATSLAELRPGFTHHSRDRRDAGVPGAGADRADRRGRSTSAPTCTRWARRCTSWPPARRRSAPATRCALDPRSSGAGAGAAGAGEPGRPGGAVGDHHAPAGEGAGPPLPDRRGPGPRPGAAAGRRRAGGGRAAGSARTTSRCGCCRRRGWSGRDARDRRAAGGVRRGAGRPVPGVLVSGAPGVGKTALVDQLRPVVTGSDGWFVAGKFDQYRRDLEFDAGLPGVPRAGPAAAGRAGGRAGRGPRADPGGARAERGPADRGDRRSSPRCWGCPRIRGIR